LAETSASLASSRVQVRPSVDWVTPALVMIFVLSGASGLIYQISWVRLLSFTFGVTIYAISIVVAAFMGGLALGSVLGGRLADRVRRPILVYAGAELLVAGLGLLSPMALSWVQSAYVALSPRDAAEAALGIVALRFALAAAVLLIPTTLMGATLPLMVKGSLSMGRNIGGRVSWLYASNTTGAILGTVGAGFFLIGTIGIADTIRTAAVFNLAAAVASVLLGAAARPVNTADFARSEEEAARDVDASATAVGQVAPFARKLVIATFAVQGFASLAYEIIWTRILALILDGSTYAFSIVLATVLLGIALGSALVGPLMGRKLPWLRIYALLQAGVAALAFLGIVVFARVIGLVDRLRGVEALAQFLNWNYGNMATIALIAILPPMLLLGASFPIAARIVVSGARNAGRDLGVLYAGNTAGAILGAWAAGFLLIPAFGTQVSIELLAAINAVLAIALILVSGRGRMPTAAFAMAMIIVSVVLAFTFAPAMYQRVVASKFRGHDVVWVGEGKETSVAVVRNQANGYRYMYINGQGQASDEPGMVWFHRLLAHLPMTLHPNPQDVLIVGLGGGATAGALSQHGVRLDVVELSETVIEGASLFGEDNYHILEYPKLHLKIDDGRNHLLLTDKKYDVITADVNHPRNAGAALIYSEEYYRQAKAALKPGGIMSQWLEDNGDNPDNDTQRRLMARTFSRVFPNVTLWVFGALMLGTDQPLDYRQETLESRWAGRNLGTILEGSGFDSPEAVRSLFAMTDPELRAWAGEGPVMTDNHPFVEYFLSLPGGSRTVR
jgi:spermidine synthase